MKFELSLLDKIFGKSAPMAATVSADFFKTLSAYTPVFTSWGGSLYESELVRASINARATHASKLKVEAFGSERSKLVRQFRTGPNEWQTWSQFLYRLSTILDVNNTAFIVPVYGLYGDTVEGIYPVLPSRCEMKVINGVQVLKYSFASGDTATIELDRCGILTKMQYKDDFFGETNRALTPTMELISIQNQGITEGIKSAATYRFMAQISNFTKAEDLAKERQRFSKENLEGEGGGLLLFPNTYQNIQQINSKPFVVDAAQMDCIRKNVFEYFGVNEDVLQNKAYGDAWAAFYEGAIEPFAIQLSDVLSKMLFSDGQRAKGSGIICSSNRLQYISTKEKLDVSSQLADRGILNRDEVREIWNLPPLPNGEGQEYIIRGEYKNAADQTGGEEDAQ